MAKPVLLTVDDDPEILRALERDLQHEYGEHFRVLVADSGAVAMETLQKLKLRNEPVGLLLVDYQLPQTSGVEFLEQTIKLFPDAKRVLMTAYAETDSAIRAINAAKIHYLLQKPWHPPEEHLYPILNDLLDAWRSSSPPPFEGIRVVGSRWLPKSYEIKDFLSRNQVPYKWLDIDNQEASGLVTDVGADALQLPLVFFPDGSHLVQPSNIQVAEKIGLKTHAEMPFYDLIIVGAGSAGLAASVYGASEGLSTVIIEREAPGGQAGTTSRIENYLGFPVGLSGSELVERAVIQAKRFGVEIITPQEVIGIRIPESCRVITLKDGTEISCHAVLIATGVEWRKLDDVPGIDKLTGAGVYYGAAMTEALSCGDQDVCIVGGGNSAGQAAMYISKYARHVTMLVRGDSLAKSMSQYLINQISETENITVRLRSSVVEVQGENSLQAITIADAETGEQQTVPTTSLFILIGAVPHTDWLDGVVERDDRGFILSGPDLIRNGSRPQGWTLERDCFLLESSVPGIFVAGDVRHGSVKRVACAVGEGSLAIHCIHQYLSHL